jgi:hypothetical protein
MVLKAILYYPTGITSRELPEEMHRKTKTITKLCACLTIDKAETAGSVVISNKSNSSSNHTNAC